MDYVWDYGDLSEGQDSANRKLAYSLEANICLQHSLFVRGKMKIREGQDFL